WVAEATRSRRRSTVGRPRPYDLRAGGARVVAGQSRPRSMARTAVRNRPRAPRRSVLSRMREESFSEAITPSRRSLLSCEFGGRCADGAVGGVEQGPIDLF